MKVICKEAEVQAMRRAQCVGITSTQQVSLCRERDDTEWQQE